MQTQDHGVKKRLRTQTPVSLARDRENRRNNIVIYRLDESNAQSAEDRKKNKILKHVWT